MRKTRIGKIAAGMMAAALVLQSVFVPVMADDTASESTEVLEDLEALEGLEEIGDLTGLTGPVGTEITVSGSVAGSPEIEGMVVTATDPAEGATSFSGVISSSGISFEFAAYADKNQIVLQIPGVPKILSLDLNADLSNTLIGQMLGQEQAEMISKVMQLCTAAMDPMSEKMQKIGEEITAIFTEAAGKLEFEAAEAKEFDMGGEKIQCQGLKTVISPDLVKAVVTKLLAVELPNGQTYEEYFNMVLSVSGTSGDGSAPASVQELVAAYLDTLPELTLVVYSSDTGAVPEIDLIANGSTLALQMRGAELTPWTEIAVNVDGTDMAVMKIDFDDSGFKASLNVQGQDMGSLAVNMTDMSFELNITGMPAPITGYVEYSEEGEPYIYLVCDQLLVTIHLTETAFVEKPEGDVLDLTSMTEEDFNSLVESIGSIFGSVSVQGAA